MRSKILFLILLREITVYGKQHVFFLLDQGFSYGYEDFPVLLPEVHPVSMNSIACSRLRISRRCQLQCFISGGRTCIGQMLGLADIQLDVFGLTILSDNHTAVYFFARPDKQSSTLLSGEQTVSNCLTGFKCNQRSLLTILDISLVWCISVEMWYSGYRYPW